MTTTETTAYKHECQKCGHEWVSLDSAPLRCASCKSPYWKRPVVNAKQKARRILTHAIRSGQLVRPDTCSSCGKAVKVQGHHADYEQPLVVTWLCVTCHHEEHKRLRREAGFVPKTKPQMPTLDLNEANDFSSVMRALGQRGGKAKSEAKTAAARKNGGIRGKKRD